MSLCHDPYGQMKKRNEEVKTLANSTIPQKKTLEPQTVNISKQQLIWIYAHADFEKKQSQPYLLRGVMIFF